MAHKLNSIYNKERSEILRLEIDKDFEESENPQLNVKTDLKYRQLAN